VNYGQGFHDVGVTMHAAKGEIIDDQETRYTTNDSNNVVDPLQEFLTYLRIQDF
jgi:hypothetical protein